MISNVLRKTRTQLGPSSSLDPLLVLPDTLLLVIVPRWNGLSKNSSREEPLYTILSSEHVEGGEASKGHQHTMPAAVTSLDGGNGDWGRKMPKKREILEDKKGDLDL